MFFAPNEHKDGQFWYWLQTLESGYGYIGSQIYLHENVLNVVGMNDFILLFFQSVFYMAIFLKKNL